MIFASFLAVICAFSAAAQHVKRVVIVKIDGLPGYYVDRFVRQRDPQTGKSILPWIDEAFYKNGTRVPNFYTRGMSLSGPSWGQLDTGQHLQIKGNVEYDRYTLHPYDYLNFLPYYFGYLSKTRTDMPATEVMDQLKIPLLCDAFPYEKRYTSQQLYQRGNEWSVLENGAMHLYPGNMNDFADEWALGLDFRKMTIDQNERDIIARLARPEIEYLDYYDTSFDHVSHHNSDIPARLATLKELDRLIGRLWVAIQASPEAAETALVLISDHGFNSEEGIYSQGFNLVKMLASTTGGGHHVITKRRLMLDYSIKGVYPFVPLIRTSSNDSYYLKGQSSTYPTALVDFDGNERSSIHLRNSDLNLLHILLQQMQHTKLSPELKAAATKTFFTIVDQHRSEWQSMVSQMNEELDALHRWIEPNQKIVAANKKIKKFPPAEIARGIDKEARRIDTFTTIAIDAEADYRKYTATLNNLLDLKRESFDPHKLKIEHLIAEQAMGDSNSINQLQNYVAGPSVTGMKLDTNKNLDLDRSFTRINYFDLLYSQIVHSNMQHQVASRPIDFVAIRVPLDSVSAAFGEDVKLTDDPIWLYSGPDKQALILSRSGNDGLALRYLPIAGLRQDENGKVSFERKSWADGFPLKYFEDKNLAIPSSERAAWLSGWHTEMEWLGATHKTAYSNAIIGLTEQLDRHPLNTNDSVLPDDKLIARLRQRQRRLVEADMLILANNHWNFDVRGFNPGGNHGSFFRVSTNSTFMIAGGDKTGIPRGLAVESPYDGMSFMPTILRLMGKIDSDNQPIPELQTHGFHKFPGKVINEITRSGNTAADK